MWRRGIWPLSEAGVMRRQPLSLGSLFVFSLLPSSHGSSISSLFSAARGRGHIDKTQKNLGLGSGAETQQGWGKSLFPFWVFLFLPEKAERLSEFLSEFPTRKTLSKWKQVAQALCST